MPTDPRPTAAPAPGPRVPPDYEGMPYPRNYSTERWDIPAPAWWNRGNYAPLLLPRSEIQISQACAQRLMTEDWCQRDASCQLGVVYAMDPSTVQLAAAANIDAAAFVRGSQKLASCVNAATQFYMTGM